MQSGCDTLGFKLEDPESAAFLKHLVGLFIIHRDIIQVYPALAVRFDVFNGPLKNGKSAQAEEIHLYQPKLFARFHRILRRYLSLAELSDRHHVARRLRRYDYARCVLRAVPCKSLDMHCRVQQLFDLGLSVVHLLQFRHFGKSI